MRQYSVWLQPTDPNAIIPDGDMWLFDQPLLTFPMFTPQGQIRRRMDSYHNEIVQAGNGKTPALRVLKKRTVTFGNWDEAMLDE